MTSNACIKVIQKNQKWNNKKHLSTLLVSLSNRIKLRQVNHRSYVNLRKNYCGLVICQLGLIPGLDLYNLETDLTNLGLQVPVMFNHRINKTFNNVDVYH